MKQANDGLFAALHTLETVDPMLRDSANELHELKIEEAERNLAESIREISRTEGRDNVGP